ncbi:MAG: ABC transporter ATP-binding protein [Alphaproteobacteria bacterium]
MSAGPCVQISAIAKNYGRVRALKGVTLAIAPGECVALAGRNGAGKTTLVKLMLGLVRPSAGEILVLGQVPGGKQFHQTLRRIGFLPEQVLFQPAMTARETLGFFAALKGVSRTKLGALLDHVDLAAAADARIGTFSKGMRQRLGLAQALIGAPDLLLLDEPTSGLDPLARRRFYRIIDAVKAQGTAVVISSHALSELDSRADKVAILDQGRLLASGTWAQLRHQAGLSTRIKLKSKPEVMTALQARYGTRFGPLVFANGTAVLAFESHQKIAILQEIVGAGLVLDDIEMIEPSLDDVFAEIIRNAQETHPTSQTQGNHGGGPAS